MPEPRIHAVLHGHFYQPPRENPWTGEVPREPAARPFRDWNSRIAAECYAANAFARLGDSAGRCVSVRNNYEQLSFNFGPTLLRWLERADPRTYGLILAADRTSRAARGHGNAIAQAWHHAILPLLDQRDRRTLIRWGLADFRERFGRESEGLWLPETAADRATMEDLADEGVRFVILAPRQARRVRRIGSEHWVDVSPSTIDTTMPYRCFPRGPGGPHVDVLIYDGELASDLAFGDALGTSDRLLDRVRARTPAGRTGPILVHAATDGETFGHHHKFGERALAHAMVRPSEITWTNYAAFLDLRPPDHELEIEEGADGLGTSWSCAHGTSRWRGGCDCGQYGGESQAWRAPLRAALALLRARSGAVFATLAEGLFRDPEGARDAYVELLTDRTPARVDRFLGRWARGLSTTTRRARALRLLDMEGQALAMFTSCGWFFSDLADLGTSIVLRNAARVVERITELTGEDPSPGFLAVLGHARSSRTGLTGAQMFAYEAETSTRTASEIAAAFVLLSGTQDGPAEFRGHTIAVEGGRAAAVEGVWVERGRLALTRRLTGDETRLGYEWVRGPLRRTSVRLSGGPRRTKEVSVRFTLADLSPEDREEVLDREAANLLRTGAELGLIPDFAAVSAPRLLDELLVQGIEAAAAAPTADGLRACAELARVGQRASVFRREGAAQQVLFGLLPVFVRAGLDRETEDELEALAAELGFAPGVARAGAVLQASAR